MLQVAVASFVLLVMQVSALRPRLICLMGSRPRSSPVLSILSRLYRVGVRDDPQGMSGRGIGPNEVIHNDPPKFAGLIAISVPRCRRLLAFQLAGTARWTVRSGDSDGPQRGSLPILEIVSVLPFVNMSATMITICRRCRRKILNRAAVQRCGSGRTSSFHSKQKHGPTANRTSSGSPSLGAVANQKPLRITSQLIHADGFISFASIRSNSMMSLPSG